MERVKALAPSERLVFGGGWMTGNGGHAIMHILERSADGASFGFAVCNTGQGVSNHPMTWTDYPKKKAKTVIYLANVKPDRVFDEATWYMLWKQRVSADKSHGAPMLYEVILPHLVGDDASVTNAIKAGEAMGRGCEWETVQRAGTCYFRCILCTWRAIMKWEGFSKQQQKELFFMVRRYYVGLADKQLDIPRYAHALVPSDVKMIKMACHMTGLTAAKDGLSLSAATLAELRDTNLKVMAKADAIVANAALVGKDDVGFGAEQGVLLSGMSDHDNLVPFHGFELLADATDAAHLAGSRTEAAPELFVDLLEDTAIGNDDGTSGATTMRFTEFAAALERSVARCDHLRAKTTISAVSVGVHQICSLVENLFVTQLPVPPAQTNAGADEEGGKSDDDGGDAHARFWVAARTADITLEVQRACLRDIYELALHYISAAKSMKDHDRALDSARAITMACILSIFDATLRLQASPVPSPVSELLCGLGRGKVEEDDDGKEAAAGGDVGGRGRWRGEQGRRCSG